MGASCLEGYCSLNNELGVVELTDGHKSAIEGELGPRFAERMDELELQQWINEDPDAWRYFDREEIPDWLPKSDRNWLDDDSDYFNRIYNAEDNPFFNWDGFDGLYDGEGFDGPYNGDSFDGPT